jgi:Protein of unknown function (DUF3108)
MKKILFTLLSILVLWACKTTELSKGEQNAITACLNENFAFQGGEELVYKLYYDAGALEVAAGEVKFSVEDLGTQFHIVAEGKTYDSYNKIFKVDDKYETYLDKTTLLPLTSIREVHEGNYNLYDKITFNQKTQKAISLRGKTKSEATPKEYEIKNCMHDLVSILYFSRNIDFKSLTPSTYFPIEIFMDGEAHPLQVFYKGAGEKIKIKNIGKFDTQLFAPQTISGRTFKESTAINIWVSDDENKIPLLISSPLSVGSVKAMLKSHKGLRHELTSKK